MDHDLLAAWFPTPEDVDPAWARRHELADHLRTAVEELVTLDVDAVGERALEELAADLAAVRGRLEAMGDVRHHGPLALAPLPAGSLVERSPVSGRSNVVAPPLVVDAYGEVTRAHAVFGDQYHGPPGGVHGGIVAAVFDELLGIAQIGCGTAGHTGTLTIRYRALTPLYTRVDYEAECVGREGRKLFVTGRSTVDGRVTAEAEATFILTAEAAARADGG
ncbi:MAG TPA: hypothetical protein VGA69_02510 [Nitriliruptorales bacterium]